MFLKSKMKYNSRLFRLFLIALNILIILVVNIPNGNAFSYVSPKAEANSEYLGPENCLTCHPLQYNDWNTSIHSKAYRDPIFQEMWEDRGKPDECLKCHTTGYDESTLTYAVEGVTCEVCHGPGNMMEINTEPELCEQCHTGSRAREIQIGTHGMGGVKCVDCHMRPGGHTFEPTAEACARCHTASDIHTRSEIPSLRSEVSSLHDFSSQLEANISKLQNQIEVQNAELVRSGRTYTFMIYGGMAVTVVVLVGVIGFSLRRGTD